MSNFTKGEWIVDDSYSSMLYITADGHGVCEVDAYCVYDEIKISPTREQKANAKLIASAPAMYKLLSELKSVLIEVGNGENVETNKIDKLLAKARGENHEKANN